VTIEKGQPWGEAMALPGGSPVVRSDEALRALVEEHRRAGRPLPPVGLLGGDLHRTLGGVGNREDRLWAGDAVGFPVDLGCALVDGRQHWFVAHLIARNRTWTRAWAAFNAQWFERLNLAPRGHPNDGRLDIVDSRLSLGQVPVVARRARLGAHLPHPGITTRRVAADQVELDRPLDVLADGVHLGRARTISVRLEPDALTVVV
jgi:hypothetical protein